MADDKTHILLIGGGHAHVAVLADWIRNGLPAASATVLTPFRTLRYSGMVPGWISGQYQRDTGLVDLEALVSRTGAELVLDRCVALNPAQRIVKTEAGREIEFDVASIDTGGVGRADDVLGDDPRIIDVRPIDTFVDKLSGLSAVDRIAVIGGGAGGVEIAFGLRNRKAGTTAPVVTLVTGGEGILPGFSDGVRQKVIAELGRQSIRHIEEDARLDRGNLVTADGSLEPVDLIVAALGSAAPTWPAESGLACDGEGFIAVDRHQRSTSHPHIFAAGDVAARQDRAVSHSGVHAVFAGPVLAANIRSLVQGHSAVETYDPRWTNLYLISTGNGSAIASFGPFSAQGRWVAKLKHWIDMRWIVKYARLGGKL